LEAGIPEIVSYSVAAKPHSPRQRAIKGTSVGEDIECRFLMGTKLKLICFRKELKEGFSYIIFFQIVVVQFFCCFNLGKIMTVIWSGTVIFFEKV
jgi:hypothetical protein